MYKLIHGTVSIPCGAVQIACRIEDHAGVRYGHLPVVELEQKAFVPVVAVVRQLENRAARHRILALDATRLRRAVDVSSTIEHQIAGWVIAGVNSAELVKHVLNPWAQDPVGRTRRSMKIEDHSRATGEVVVAAVERRAIKRAVGTEDDACQRRRAVTSARERVQRIERPARTVVRQFEHHTATLPAAAAVQAAACRCAIKITGL